MKENYGFTLVEMLGVIIILVLLALLIFPAIGSIIKKSKEDNYNQQVDYILSAANNWVTDNASNLSTTSSNCIKLSTLKSSGFLEDKVIIDPRDDSEMNGYIKVTYDSSYKQFNKEYVNSCE